MEPLDIEPLDIAPDVDPDIDPLEPDWASAGAAVLVANKASTASFVIFFIALSCLGPRVSLRLVVPSPGTGLGRAHPASFKILFSRAPLPRWRRQGPTAPEPPRAVRAGWPQEWHRWIPCRSSRPASPAA